MGEATDFLIRYDLARSDEERSDLVADEFGRAAERQFFCRLVHDPLMRAMYELEFNGSIRYEDHVRLRRAGLTFDVQDFYPRVSYGPVYLDSVTYVAKSPFGQRWRPDGLEDSTLDQFIPRYIEGYLWRNTGGGIIASHEPLADALTIPDVEVLRLIRNPRTGKLYLEDENPEAWEAILGLPQPEDIHALRRDHMHWWTIKDRGTVLHDMSGAHWREPRNG